MAKVLNKILYIEVPISNTYHNHRFQKLPIAIMKYRAVSVWTAELAPRRSHVVSGLSAGAASGFDSTSTTTGRNPTPFKLYVVFEVILSRIIYEIISVGKVS